MRKIYRFLFTIIRAQTLTSLALLSYAGAQEINTNTDSGPSYISGPRGTLLFDDDAVENYRLQILPDKTILLWGPGWNKSMMHHGISLHRVDQDGNAIWSQWVTMKDRPGYFANLWNVAAHGNPLSILNNSRRMPEPEQGNYPDRVDWYSYDNHIQYTDVSGFSLGDILVMDSMMGVYRLAGRNGEILWHRTPYNDLDMQLLGAIAPAADGSSLVGGIALDDADQSCPRAALAKLNTQGEIIWRWESEVQEYGRSISAVAPLADGGAIVLLTEFYPQDAGVVIGESSVQDFCFNPSGNESELVWITPAGAMIKSEPLGKDTSYRLSMFLSGKIIVTNGREFRFYDQHGQLIRHVNAKFEEPDPDFCEIYREDLTTYGNHGLYLWFIRSVADEGERCSSLPSDADGRQRPEMFLLSFTENGEFGQISTNDEWSLDMRISHDGKYFYSPPPPGGGVPYFYRSRFNPRPYSPLPR